MEEQMYFPPLSLAGTVSSSAKATSERASSATVSLDLLTLLHPSLHSCFPPVLKKPNPLK